MKLTEDSYHSTLASNAKKTKLKKIQISSCPNKLMEAMNKFNLHNIRKL